jgi:hypothetical protein
MPVAINYLQLYTLHSCDSTRAVFDTPRNNSLSDIMHQRNDTHMVIYEHDRTCDIIKTELLNNYSTFEYNVNPKYFNLLTKLL